MKQSLKIIKVNHFYLIHDGSRNGHPGLVFWKDDIANLYLAIKFGTTKNQNNASLKHPISKNIMNSYVYKKTFIVKA